MNTKQLIASLAMFAAAGTSFAQSTDYESPGAQAVSSKTRA